MVDGKSASVATGGEGAVVNPGKKKKKLPSFDWSHNNFVPPGSLQVHVGGGCEIGEPSQQVCQPECLTVVSLLSDRALQYD